MELAVGLVVFVGIERGRRILTSVVRLDDMPVVFLRHALGCQARCDPFEFRDEFEQIDDLAHGGAGHDGPDAGAELHKSLGRQRAERFADRRARNGKMVAEHDLVQLFPRRQLTFDDLDLYLVGDAAAQSAAAPLNGGKAHRAICVERTGFSSDLHA